MRAVGRADLVALLDVPAVGARRAARLLGFEPPTEPVHEERPRAAPPPAEVPQSFPVIAAAPLAPMPYWKAASLVLHPPPRRAPDRGPGVSAKELASSGAWVHSAPPPPPLTPWSRVWPRLQAPLRTSVPGRVPDLARMVRRMACGLPVQRIPMRPRRRWTSRLSVWIDTSARLAPFAADQEDVVARLRRSIGTEAVRVRWLTRAVQARSVEQTGDLLTGYKVDALTPILVLGDLGTYAPDERARAAWSETARRLGHAGVRLTALVPAPRLRWAPGIAHDWQAMQWGEAAVTGPTAPEADKELRARAERLLQVASLAAYVHPGLLRTLRRLWPRDQSDPGTEVDVWTHADVVSGATGLVVRPEAAARLRAAFAADATVDAPLRERIHEAIRQAHAHFPAELRHVETLARHATAVHPASESAELHEATAFALRLARSARRGGPAQAAVRRYGQLVVPSLPPGAFAGPSGEALVQVYAACFAGTEGAPVPAGIDPEVLRKVLAGLDTPGPGVVDADDLGELWQVRQVGRRLRFERAPASGAWDEGAVRPGSPLGWLRASGASLRMWVRPAGAAWSGTRWTLHEDLTLELAAGADVRIETDRSTLVLEWAATMEPWACGVGRDRHGLWADADIRGVVQRFRYIPPGTVRLGSPEGEEGRSHAEGPTHRVTWTRGYWLGDTPVTQELWEAVMGDNPSEFRSSTRPVERVSDRVCQRFIAALSDMAPILRPRRPTEAEWEYACRGGTETSTWRGDLHLLGRNNAPLLDEIAWYGGNSGQGYELEVGEDSSDWPEKQYPHTKAGSRPVATRGPNPFGLYDMLGNVLEICADNLTPYSPDARTDPPPRKDAGTKRVIRGGAWGAFAGFVRAATRIEWRPKGRDSNFGFRLARGPAPGQAGLDPVTPRSGGPEAAEGRGRPVPAARDATPARARKREGR